MLAKILKGSKDKKVLESHLDSCPSYGYYKDLTLEKITKIIDWMLVNDYLDIDYNGRLPMIIFSEKGWETYKPVYVEELYNCILNVNIDESNQDDIVERLKGTNREVIKLYISFSSVASGHELSSSGSFNALAINFISFSTIFISI